MVKIRPGPAVTGTLTPIANAGRIAQQQIKIKQGDTVVFSANPIPGNTIAVVNTIDRLMMRGAATLGPGQEGMGRTNAEPNRKWQES